MTATRTTLLLCLIGLAAFLFINRSRTADDDFYSLKGGETIAIRSLASNKYLTLSPSSGRVTASADTASAAASQFKVLLLDIDTVSALLRSANSIDERSEAFTGRKMLTASGCQCSGYSNAFGLGRFCHPWEDAMQESWCYVSDNCSSATSRGSFGRRYESCEKPPDVPDDSDYMRQQSAAFEPDTGGSASTLVPASGCKCSGFSSKLGFGSYCKGWEYEGQTPWCYVGADCSAGAGGASNERWARTENGSFGQPYEDCVWRAPSSSSSSPQRRRLSTTHPPRRRLRSSSSSSRSGLHSLLASSPELEKFVVLLSMHSRSFLTVEPPPHKEALQLTAKSDELSIRSIFSSFERTKLILSLATNSLVNVCEEQSGEVCTGARRKGETLRLLRMPRRTARWAVERVG